MALTQDAIDAVMIVKDLIDAVHVDFEVWTQIEGDQPGGHGPWRPRTNNQSACWLFVVRGLARASGGSSGPCV